MSELRPDLAIIAENVAERSRVLDIGSNDGTSLKAYETTGLQRTGIDPTGEKFRRFYPDGVTLVPDFFSAEAYRRPAGSRPRS